MTIPKQLIIAISIILPLAVAGLFFGPKLEGAAFFDQIPFINAFINGSTAIVLVAAFIAIKNGKRNLHQRLILSALALSIVFLLLYISYHATHESTHFGGNGSIKMIYFIILISHILLAIVMSPLILFTLVRALTGKFDLHKKLARIAFPIWLYVSITGVIVYLMISPYY